MSAIKTNPGCKALAAMMVLGLCWTLSASSISKLGSSAPPDLSSILAEMAVEMPQLATSGTSFGAIQNFKLDPTLNNFLGVSFSGSNAAAVGQAHNKDGSLQVMGNSA